MPSFLRRKPLLAGAFVACATLLATERPAQAVLTWNVYQSGSDVVVSASGSLNLPTPLFNISGACSGSNGLAAFNDTIPAIAYCTGIESSANIYSFTGPQLTSQGVNGDLYATSASGNFLAMTTAAGGNPTLHFLAVYDTYANNTAIGSSTATFANAQLSDFGFTSDGLIGTWTLDGTGDIFSICVGAPGSPCDPPAAATPGPLPLFGAAAAFGYSRRLRRRVNQASLAAPLAGPISA